ncbi:MAG: hypothetical protein U1C49_02280 [Candidatus Andersenbacteria bacterium]|nr:hypothetical protein [Candidatus Andersenbacteria bacterium]
MSGNIERLFKEDANSSLLSLDDTLARPSGGLRSTQGLPPRQNFAAAKLRRGPGRQALRRSPRIKEPNWRPDEKRNNVIYPSLNRGRGEEGGWYEHGN